MWEHIYSFYSFWCDQLKTLLSHIVTIYEFVTIFMYIWQETVQFTLVNYMFCSFPNIVFSYLPLYCFQASVITKARTQCYTPCSNAVYKPGQCCPSCEGKFANHHNLERWKSYAHLDIWIKQRFSSIASFFKWELLLKERIHSQRERIISYMSSSL